jgi:sugar O-acyltransferase (sialic acid O-acetyltransferase NeuD family)
MKKLLVMGASGHGKVVADAALAACFDVIAFADDDPAKRGDRLLGIEVRAIGLEEAIGLCRETEAVPVVAIGSNAARMRVFLSLRGAGLQPATIVHPAATVASSASLGAGTVVFAGVVVNPDTTVGENVILNTGATIDHDNHIGFHAHISPGAHLGGTVTVGEGTHVGIGSTIKNNVAVGAWSVIGAGSTVVRDIPDGVVAYGVPARVVRPNGG